MLYLHSTMVELKPLDKYYQEKAYQTFTFHYGRIKTDNVSSDYIVEVEFTFHYGRIKTHPRN